MAQNSRYFFVDVIELDDKAAQKHLTGEGAEALSRVQQRFEQLDDWSASAVHATLAALAAELGVGLGKIAQPLRVAVTGGTVSPPIDATVALIGRQRVLGRITRAVEWARRA
jgi:glutamyl-tRNA synthetase